MERLMAYKCRLYPSKEQEKAIDQTLNCSRYVYNKLLERRKKAYERRGETISKYESSAIVTQMKEYEPWLREADSQALIASVFALDAAYKNWWREIKKGNKDAGPPRFKSRYDHDQSYTTTCGASIHIDGNKMKLPKLGWVRFVCGREIEGDIRRATVRKTPTEKYFVSLLCKVDIEPKPAVDTVIGVNMGVTEFMVDSNNEHYGNPRYYEKMQQKLAREQRKLSRKQHGSANYEKQRKKVAICHEKISNMRSDYQHKLSRKLVDENQVICTRDLKIKDMMNDSPGVFITKQINDAAWGDFFRMLDYKAEWAGRVFVTVDNQFPSSQICHVCGYRNTSVNASTIEWDCPNCDAHHNKSYNAAVNILNEGLEILTSEKEKEPA